MLGSTSFWIFVKKGEVIWQKPENVADSASTI
jgi:hypothetical protein